MLERFRMLILEATTASQGAESDPGAETGYKLNGATVRNGSVHKDKAPQDAERIEYPKDSDKRKLTQLFDAFKVQKKTDSPERRLQQQTSVRRATSRRYGTDSESSSSSSDEDVSSSLPSSMLTTVSVQSSPASSRVSGNNTSEYEEIHVSDSVLHKTSESVNSSPRKSLQRKHSYDSDQTIHSDDAPFSKSSTETQIRVEVHSDASSTQSADICRPKTSPSKSASSNSQNSYSKVRQSSKDGYTGVKVTRKESSSSQRSTSPEMGSMRHVQVSRQSVLQPGRSPSPYSFDSIPSSHANSPLPRQRILDQTLDYPLQKYSSEDTDSLSRFSGTEYSGTESSSHIREGSSGGDDFMMDDISKVKFHKLSKKMESSRSRSPHSPNTSSSLQLEEGGANCGRVEAVVGRDQLTRSESQSVTNVPQSLSQVEGNVPQPLSQIEGNVPQSLSQVEGNNPQSLSQVEGNIPQSLLQVEGNIPQSLSQVEGNVPQSLSQVEGNVPQSLSQVEGNVPQSLSQVEGNVPQSLSQVEGIIQAQQTSTQYSMKISDCEPIAPARRKAKIVITDPIIPPRKKNYTEPKPVAPPRKEKHSDDTDLIVPPPRKSKHVKEAELAVSLRKLQNPEESEPVTPPRRSKVTVGFEPISPPRKSKNVDLVCPSGYKVVQDPDPVAPVWRRSMRRSHEDVPSPPSSVPSSPVSFSGEDSSSERNLSIKNAKRLFEEKERIQRLGKSPRASPRGNHDAFFNDRIWQEESLGMPSTPSPAPDDDFEALFSKAISDLEAPESPLPKIRSRSGSMRSRSGSKSKKRPVSGELESDSESRKRTSTGELPVVKEPEGEGLKSTMLPVMKEPVSEEVMDSIQEQQVTSLPTINIILDNTDMSQKWDLEPETESLVIESRAEGPDKQSSQDIEPSMTSDTYIEGKEKSWGQNESDDSPVESLDLKVKAKGHWGQDPDDDNQYQFSTEEQEINAESEQSVSSNLWHFKENSTENDFREAFGSPSEKNGQFLEVRTTVRAALGEQSLSDTSSDILSVIAEDSEPSETSTRSWDSGGKCSTVKAASGVDSDCDRTMERIPVEMILAAAHSRIEDVDTEKESPYVEESIGQVKGTVTYIEDKEDNDVAVGYHGDEKMKTDMVYKEHEKAVCSEPKKAEVIPVAGTLLALIKLTKKHQDDDMGVQRHLEPEVTIKDTPQLEAEGTVSKKVFREKLVKQWLEAEVHSSEGSSESKIQKSLNQVSDPQSSHNLTLDPYHTGQSSTPGTHPLDSTQIPVLPIGSLTDTDSEKEVPPKLSPRASSEGSGSLEDSGHVSGTSTQDNTPEHRRTDSIQSQMSVPSTLSTVTDVSNKEDDSEADIDELVASHKASTQSSYGSSRGNLLSTVADSRESIASFYSDAGGVNYGKVPVTGEVQFGLDYNYRTGSLEIAIRQCKDLAPADPKRHRSDPYVKTYLLPDKTRGGKRKTRVKKSTLSPIFDETLRYLISKSEVENRILWVTVWHNDRFGRNDFLGEVSINFDYFRFGDSAPKWYTLQERVETQTTSLLTYQGDLILSLRLVSKDNVKEILTSPTKTKRKKTRPDGLAGCQLQVLLKEARNLTAVRSNGFSDPFCKAYLLPDKNKGLKQKTPVIKRDCNPQWNYTFIFDDVSPEELKERALELTIWDHDKISSNDFLGGVRLNLGLGRCYGKIVDWNDAKGEEISIWQAMLDRPDSWIDGTLILRPNMDKRRY
ncbi:uncharacterized protein LOC110467183 isoform X2 [Mizuhopecten yessoensis]|uniref:uncharacterized protein LOC110467183 isoform X2 n=1 Tax=Mizuhopecten yessoensis TaxID=6573 RepID=UPI000B4593F7|nr:uncharacterized protein LOC110467183 isoform X2 [Mizuhopecten yessoensis]